MRPYWTRPTPVFSLPGNWSLRALPLFNRHKWPRFRTDILGGRLNQTIVSTLYHHVGRPAGDPRDNKQRGKHRSGNATEMKSRGAIKVQVWEKLFLAPHYGFDPLGDGINSAIAVGGA